MSDKLKDLEKIIKHSFKSGSLLSQSLTHKSFDNIQNNEKLEFLGDRVLGLVISYKLLEKFPQEKEGIIDKKLANLVNKKTCLSIGKKINLKKFLILGTSHKNLDRSEDKIISDCLEAIIGAIYIDGGLKPSQKFILNEWQKFQSNNNPQNAAKIVRLDKKLWEIGLMRYQSQLDGIRVPLFAKVVMKIYLMAIEIYRMDRDEVLRDNLFSLTDENVEHLIACWDFHDTLNLEGLGIDLIKAKNSM